jgi:hypothetical protein
VVAAPVGGRSGARRDDDAMQRLTLRGLSLVSDHEVDLFMEADDGSTVTWRFTREERDGIAVVNGPTEFSETYRQVPGPPFPLWPERLVGAAIAAQREPFPAGDAAQRAIEEARADVARRWNDDLRETDR